DDDLHFEADKSFPPRTLTTQVSPKPRGQPVILTAADLAANGNDKFGFWWREDGSWFHAM
ncbi:MAG: hypothetical protein ACRENP_09390, partial [Longimicrobiales bacterium]